MGFTVFGDDKIYLEDLFRITEIIQFKTDVSRTKIEERLKNMQSKPHFKNKRKKPDEIDFELYSELVSSYLNTVFSTI